MMSKNEGACTPRTIWLASILAALAIGAAGTWYLRPNIPPQSPPLIALDKMGHLVSVKVEFADVIEFTQSRTLDIPWSLWQITYAGTRVLLIAKGDCLVGTDLRRGQYEAADAAKRHTTLVLPTPTVMQARVNHAATAGGTRLYAVSNQGIAALLPGDSNRMQAIDAAMRLAQARVEAAGRTPEVIQAAKENAELVLRGSFASIGWTVYVVWK